MALLSEILCLNHNGVVLLGQGKAIEAMRIFQAALSDLTGSLCQMDQSSDGTSAWHTITPVPLFGPDLQDDEASPNNVFRIYTNAFISDQGMSDADEAAMMLLYNFALAWQLRGVSEGKAAYLRKALKVYGLLLNMFETRNNECGGPGWKLLKLALWTNVGHIHAHHVRFEDAKECTNRLRELLFQSFDLPMEDLLFFNQAVFHMDMQGSASLAPAA